MRIRLLVLVVVAAFFAAVVGLGGADAATFTSGGWTTNASVSPTSVGRGSVAAITATVRSTTTRSALVDIEVYSSTGTKLSQRFYDNQVFAANVTRSFVMNWTVPANEPLTAHTVKIGIFAPGWSALQHWNNSAATFTVIAQPTTTTTVAGTTTTGATTTTTAAPGTTTTTAAPVSGSCGLPGPAAFCDTFSTPAGAHTLDARTGDLNPAVWGVSRTSSNVNPDQNLLSAWAPSHIDGCGSTATVQSPQDVRICNGQLFEATNDNDVQTVLAMYPKQPFDFAGRTGTVTFDLSSDSQGSHGAWPEFWITDTPQPAPQAIVSGGQMPDIRNGIGFRLADDKCNGNPALSGVDAIEVQGNFQPQPSSFTKGGCITDSHAGGALNHFVVKVSQTHMDVYGTNPGSTALVLLASANYNLSITRGLVWLEDVHYNASKDGYPVHQSVHTFAWDNLGFDGPKTYRDAATDIPDSNTAANGGLQNLGYVITATPQTFTLPGPTWSQTPTGAWVTLNWDGDDQVVPTVSVNGGPSHTVPWPFDPTAFNVRSIPIPIPPSELHNGTNTVAISYTGARGRTTVFDVDLIAVAAAPVP